MQGTSNERAGYRTVQVYSNVPAAPLNYSADDSQGFVSKVINQIQKIACHSLSLNYPFYQLQS